jgi:thioredoxin 1
MSSVDDDELERIRARKVEAMMRTVAGKDPRRAVAEPILLTDGTFDSAVAESPLLVLDCWAPWCGPCKMIAPVINELALEYQGRIRFGKLNIDENPKTATRFNVMGIPTLLVFKGGKLVDRIIGAVPRSDIEIVLKRHM